MRATIAVAFALVFVNLAFSQSKLPPAAKRKLFQSIPAQYQMIACHAGKTQPVHEKILERCFEQYFVKMRHAPP